MSTRLQMLQVARLAPRLLGESAGLVADFIGEQWHEAGGLCDRAGQCDLYYTVFGIEVLRALQAEPPRTRLEPYLAKFGAGSELDWVHLACLIRCRANLNLDRSEGPGIALRLEAHRAADGLYSGRPGAARGTVYDSFLALGAYEDLGLPLPEPERLRRALDALPAPDGGFGNAAGARAGTTPTSCAAALIYRALEAPPPPALGAWLRARLAPGGGFFAAPGAPLPDLLSTATTLHALTVLGEPLATLREPCLDFVDSLWTNRGGFYGHWHDDVLDAEYTYYGLLALGHLT